MSASTVVVILRALAQMFGIQGKPREASALSLLADGVSAGVDVDEHMAKVAEALKSGLPVDDAAWDDVHARIQEDAARLQGGAVPVLTEPVPE